MDEIGLLDNTSLGLLCRCLVAGSRAGFFLGFGPFRGRLGLGYLRTDLQHLEHGGVPLAGKCEHELVGRVIKERPNVAFELVGQSRQ